MSYHDSAALLHVNRVIGLWNDLGSTTSVLNVDLHDQIFAYSSHLPHVVAYSLLNTLKGLEQDDLLAEYAPYLKMVNSSFDSSWIQQVHHHRVDAAQPVIPPNFSDKILPHRTPVRDLYLANTTQVYPEDRGTNYSVRLGRKVIRMLLEDKGFPITGTLPIPPIPSSFTVSGDL